MAIKRMVLKNAPIEEFIIDSGDSELGNTMTINPNWETLELAREQYQGGHQHPIHVAVYDFDDRESESVGISIEAAREIIETLQSMIAYITHD